MKMLIKYLFIPAAFLLFIGCKKNKDVTPAAPQKTLLKKENRGTAGTSTYTHDEKGRMKTAEYSGNASNPASLYTFKTYGEQDRLLESTHMLLNGSASSDKLLFFYTFEGKLERIDFYNPSTGPRSGYITYQYTASNLTEEVYSASNALSYYTVYRYDASGKNIVQIDYYNASGTLQAKSVYSNFDSKKTTAALFPLGYGASLAHSENNYQILVSTVYPSGNVTTQVFTYEYNTDGYVTKRTSGTGSVVEFEYAKQ